MVLSTLQNHVCNSNLRPVDYTCDFETKKIEHAFQARLEHTQLGVETKRKKSWVQNGLEVSLDAH